MARTGTLPLSKRQAKFAVGGAVVLFALVGLVAWAMARPQATAFTVGVADLEALGATPPGEEVRVAGRVVAGSIERDGLATSFAIRDGGRTLVVTTEQPMPDAFRDGSEVMARGSFDGDRLTASQVLAKCPSKFEAA
jgi:cytochrome c-type biogenesis protein CcmE